MDFVRGETVVGRRAMLRNKEESLNMIGDATMRGDRGMAWNDDDNFQEDHRHTLSATTSQGHS